MPTKPKIWTKKDMPSPSEMEEYLARIRAVKGSFPGLGFPEIPEDMDHLTAETANDIERVLLMAHNTIGALEKSRVYSGELQSGGF